MLHPISPLGAIHTAISLIPIFAGLYGFIRYGRIDPATNSGKVYIVSLVLSVITSFGVSSTGALNPGHAFGIVVLLVAFGGILAGKLTFLGRLRPYLSVFGLSFSFLLSLVPGTNETLTRLPLSHPLADAPLAPVVLHTLLVWFAIFVVGVCTQCLMIYWRNKSAVRN
ncbi:hypothetical protein SAMN05192560_2196 [Methylobacillus rhizosphaerae]|uniref:DUF2306 domain-containing protein n=1 Tax=Methylobacillus rhizosphaerae TaxID=551994 RepID=A0A239AZK2_9PROT|nr:hypothetical protein [Methylobacillus rhizosphaerae]SNS00752.1 hypothetical protein SAMN05192560_2196 [Methylobacillus rhizosphaerae]